MKTNCYIVLLVDYFCKLKSVQRLELDLAITPFIARSRHVLHTAGMYLVGVGEVDVAAEDGN